MVPPWLPELFLFDDPEPHGAALNMALDEAILTAAPGPVLRVYRWARPSVSFGYFEHWESIRAAHPTRDAVRRWTGGGVVLHGEDFTYSLLIPRAAGIIPLPAAESYGLIHRALCQALTDCSIPAEPAPASTPKTSHDCFENPVTHDLLVQGRKVAGAAQRRSQAGLLHQGSVQTIELPAGFAEAFAARLAKFVTPRSFDFRSSAEKLAVEKYGSHAWKEMR